MGILDNWNKNKFSVYKSEEKTVLKLIEKLGTWVENLVIEVDKKTDLYGDHKGSWQGLNRPTMSEEGLRATVENLIDVKIPWLNVLVNNITLDIETLRKDGEKTLSDDEVFQKAITILSEKGGKLLLSKDEYNISTPLLLKPQIGYNSYAPNRKYKIYSNAKTVVNYSGIYDFFTIGTLEWGTSDLSQGYIDVELENIRFRNLGGFVNGLDVLNVRKINFKNVEVRGFRKGIHLLNVWNSSSMEEVIVWNADKGMGGIGIHIDRGSNNINYKNCAVLGLEKGILISGTNTISNIGHIFTNLFNNLDVEYCKFGILIDPKNVNVANINFKTCHFENNIYHLVTYHTNTIWNLGVNDNYFLGGDINIATRTDEMETDLIFGNEQVIGGEIANNFICNGKLRINRDEEIIMRGFENYGNSYYGTTPNGDSGIVSLNLRNSQTEKIQKRYDIQPITPTRYDDKGDNGDIRWDETNLYLKTPNGWRVVPTNKYVSYVKNNPSKITGKVTIEQQTIAGWGNKDITFTVNGVDVDSGLIVKMTPRKWLETGVSYVAYVSALNTVTLRLIGSGNQTTLQPQDWYYEITKINDL